MVDNVDFFPKKKRIDYFLIKRYRKVMASEGSHPFFKDPHEDFQKIGLIPITLHYKTSKEYPSTCAALSDLAEVTIRDNQSKENGDDDYRMSLERLLNSLDVFIKEKSHGKSTAGDICNYDKSSNGHLTVLLLWQIRHVLTHRGGIIDDNCKKNYKRIFQLWETNQPIIDLPSTLPVGKKFCIRFEDYEKIYMCVFEIFQNHVSQEDLIIFSARSSIANIKIQNLIIPLKTSQGTILLDSNLASEHGFKFNLSTREIISPEGSYYSIEEEKIFLVNGKSFPAKFDETNKLEKIQDRKKPLMTKRNHR